MNKLSAFALCAMAAFTASAQQAASAPSPAASAPCTLATMRTPDNRPIVNEANKHCFRRSTPIIYTTAVPYGRPHFDRPQMGQRVFPCDADRQCQDYARRMADWAGENCDGKCTVILREDTVELQGPALTADLLGELRAHVLRGGVPS